MAIDERYRQQGELLVRTLPSVASDTRASLSSGGTEEDIVAVLLTHRSGLALESCLPPTGILSISVFKPPSQQQTLELAAIHASGLIILRHPSLTLQRLSVKLDISMGKRPD